MVIGLPNTPKLHDSFKHMLKNYKMYSTISHMNLCIDYSAIYLLCYIIFSFVASRYSQGSQTRPRDTSTGD